MNIVYKTNSGRIVHGDNIEVMQKIKENSVDSCISDFPYDLSFMGKKWDNTGNFYEWCKDRAIKLYRIIKSGGYVCIFGHPKTNHRMKSAFEDVGFNIVEEIDWVYGTGFPKNQDIGKLFDKKNNKTDDDIKKIKDELRDLFSKSGLTSKELNEKCGFEASGYLRKSSTWETILPSCDKWEIIKDIIKANKNFTEEFKEAERRVIGIKPYTNSKNHFVPCEDHTQRVQLEITTSTTEQAKKWDGWKTAGLKPAHEPITVFQKPLEGTYIQNINKHNCGGMNIDACRIPTSQEDKDIINAKSSKNPTTNYSDKEDKIYGAYAEDKSMPANEIGRFPANMIFDSFAGEILDRQSGISKSTGGSGDKSKGALGNNIYGKYKNEELSTNTGGLGDVGGASRYFLNINSDNFVPFYYCPKATKKEKGTDNIHVTVKPKELIKWLIKLVTPKDGRTIDITAGSGTHGLACEELNKNDGYNLKWLNIELLNTKKEPYCDIAKNRIIKIC